MLLAPHLYSLHKVVINIIITLKNEDEVASVLNQVPDGKDGLGNGGVLPRILELGTKWRSVVSFTSPAPIG